MEKETVHCNDYIKATMEIKWCKRNMQSGS